MSSTLAELTAQLTRDQPITGVVVSLTGSTARIATSNGMLGFASIQGERHLKSCICEDKYA